MDNPIPYIQLFIIIQVILFLVYLSLEQRLTSLSNRLLGVLITIIGIHMAINLVGSYLPRYFTSGLAIGLGYCYGPMLFYYSRSLTYEKFILKSSDIIHLIPAFISTLVSLYTSLSIYIIASGIFLSLTGYAFVTALHLRRYRMVLSQTRSEFESIALRWLSNLLVLQIALLAINIMSVSLYANGYSTGGMIAEVFLFSGLWLLVTMIIFQGMQHPMMFSGITAEDEQLMESSAESSSISVSELEHIMEQIKANMTEKKSYLNSGLTVKSLGRQLTIVPKNISLAINKLSGKNFSEFINTFRVKHACELLQSESSESMSIMDIMLESGFITKSNFNRVFKAETGKTPYQYRKSMNI